MITSVHTGCVVDASVGIKWFMKDREDDREIALAIRQQHIEGQAKMIVPELFLLEVPNAIHVGRRGTESQLAEVLQVLHDLDFQVERHTFAILRKTNTVVSAYMLTWYDAVYVALAELLGCPFVTADQALVRKMRGHHLVVPLKLWRVP